MERVEPGEDTCRQGFKYERFMLIIAPAIYAIR